MPFAPLIYAMPTYPHLINPSSPMCYILYEWTSTQLHCLNCLTHICEYLLKFPAHVCLDPFGISITALIFYPWTFCLAKMYVWVAIVDRMNFHTAPLSKMHGLYMPTVSSCVCSYTWMYPFTHEWMSDCLYPSSHRNTCHLYEMLTATSLNPLYPYARMKDHCYIFI